jgi:hypothetical protein
MRYPAIFCFAILACVIARNVRADDYAPEPGFTALFNGKDLTGWHHKDGPPLDGKTDAGDGRWTVKEDGILQGNNAKGRVLLWTVRNFPKNFVLRLEFRPVARTDSGIFFDKVQLQCGDFSTYAYKGLRDFKPQDWNVMEITVKDGSAYCTCNGELLEAALKVPAFQQLALEADRNQIEYRHIRIKELPE